MLKFTARHFNSFEEDNVIEGGPYAELAALIENDLVEFAFHPKISMEKMQCIGFEMLFREHDNQNKNLTKEEIACLNNAHDLEEVIIEKAVAAARRLSDELNDANSQLTFCINTSTKSALDPTFTKRMYALGGLCVLQNIILEFPFADVKNGPADLGPRLLALQSDGFRICLDNCDSYGDLAQLTSDIAYDEVKIDRSLTSKCTENGACFRDLKKIIQFVQESGKMVTVAGIETLSEFQAVDRLGPNFMQGFLIERPLRRKCVADWVQNWPTTKSYLSKV